VPKGPIFARSGWSSALNSGGKPARSVATEPRNQRARSNLSGLPPAPQKSIKISTPNQVIFSSELTNRAPLARIQAAAFFAGGRTPPSDPLTPDGKGRNPAARTAPPSRSRCLSSHLELTRRRRQTSPHREPHGRGGRVGVATGSLDLVLAGWTEARCGGGRASKQSGGQPATGRAQVLRCGSYEREAVASLAFPSLLCAARCALGGGGDLRIYP